MAERQATRPLARRSPTPAAAPWADTAPADLLDFRLRPITAPRVALRGAAPAPPRDYTAGAASVGTLGGVLAGAMGSGLQASLGTGLARGRTATLDARRSFVALKLTYLDATASLQGAESQWLREQVRTAEEPIDLWLLRAPLFASLAGSDPDRRRLRQRVRRAIEAMFGEPQPTTTFAALR